MGFFDAIKSFVDSGDQNNCNMEERDQLINKLMHKEDLKNSQIMFKLINTYKRYSQLSFGENVDISEVLLTFGINKDEIPIFYLVQKKGVIFGNATAKVVITDTAIYCHPEQIKRTVVKSNRIAISDLSKYIIQYKMSDAFVGLYSSEQVVILFKKSIMKSYLSFNTEVDLLYNLLFELQQFFVESEPLLKRDRLDLMHWLSGEINDKLRKDKIESYLTDLLYRTQEEKLLYTVSTNLLLKLFLYRRQKTDFLVVINEIKELDDVSNATLVETFEKDIVKYISELNDYSIVFSTECLQDADILINRQIEPSDIIELTETKKAVLDVYNKYSRDIEYSVAIKNNPQIDLKDFVYSLDFNHMLENDKMYFLELYFSFKNKSMEKIFVEIQNSSCSFEKYHSVWCDGYGLTPLHYAFILKDEKAIDYYLDRIPCESSILNLENDVDIVRNYAIAAILSDNRQYVHDIIACSSDLEPLHKNVKLIKLKIKAEKAIALTMELSASAAQRQLDYLGSAVTEEQRSLQSDNIDGVVCGASEIRSAIELLEEQLQETMHEIESVTACILRKCIDCADRIKNSNSSIFKLFVKLYTNPELLKESLAVQDTNEYYIEYVSGYCMYILKRIADKGRFEKNQFEEDSFSSGSKESRCEMNKPYRDSWFSPEAHCNYEILVREYHKLAVEYHPDNNNYNVAIFLDIQDEKARITELLK